MGTTPCYNKGSCIGGSYHADPQLSGATWCADSDKSQSCKAEGGQAKVFYGSGLEWQQVTLNNGDEISCDRSAWKKSGASCGCEPSPFLSAFGGKKWCFKIQEQDPPNPTEPVCCAGDYSVTVLGYTHTETVPYFQAANAAEAKALIRPYADNPQIPYAIMPSNINSIDELTDDIYNTVCDNCASSAHAPITTRALQDLNLFQDFNLNEPVFNGFQPVTVEPEPNAFAVNPEQWLPMALLAVALLVVVNLAWLLYLCGGACARKVFSSRKQYGVVKQFDVESEAEQLK